MKNTTQKNKNGLLIGIVIVLVIALVTCLFIFKEKPTQVDQTSQSDYHQVEYDGKNYEYNSSIVSILFMGIDSTDPETIGQADALDLILLNRDTETIQVVSISRDTMTDIHLYDIEHNSLGWDEQHLGLAYAYGDTHKNGAMLTSQAVSKLLFDVPVVHFAAMDLTKLPLVQEVVGDMEVVVPNNSLIDINPSWVQGSTAIINKDNVESFVRTRDIEKDFSNTERMERQKAYMNAYVEKIKEMLSNNFDNTVTMLYNVCKEMTTNITLENVQAFASMLMSYSYNQTENFYTLQGSDSNQALHDEFEVDRKALQELVLKLFYEEEI